MTAKDSKSYLNKLSQYMNTKNAYHHYTGKTPIGSGYSDLTKEVETNHKAPKFKVGESVMITQYKNIFKKGYTENWS